MAGAVSVAGQCFLALHPSPHKVSEAPLTPSQGKALRDISLYLPNALYMLATILGCGQITQNFFSYGVQSPGGEMDNEQDKEWKRVPRRRGKGHGERRGRQEEWGAGAWGWSGTLTSVGTQGQLRWEGAA